MLTTYRCYEFDFERFWSNLKISRIYFDTALPRGAQQACAPSKLWLISEWFKISLIFLKLPVGPWKQCRQGEKKSYIRPMKLFRPQYQRQQSLLIEKRIECCCFSPFLWDIKIWQRSASENANSLKIAISLYTCMILLLTETINTPFWATTRANHVLAPLFDVSI